MDALLSQSSSSMTCTRASVQTVTDHDGIYRQAQNNELAYMGLHRVENLLRRSVANPGSRVLNGAIPASWSWQGTGGVTVSSPTYGSFSDGVEYVQYTVTHASGGTNFPLFRFVSALTSIAAVAGQKVAYRFRIQVTASSGGCQPQITTYVYTSASAYITQYNTAIVAASTTLADGVYGTATPHTLVGATIAYSMPAFQITVPSGGAITLRIANVHMQRVQGASNLVASKYVDAITTYNAGVAGVEYLSTINANTVNGSTLALTEAVGTAITNAWNGLDAPYTSTNSCTYSEDLTNAAWTADGVVPTNDGTLGPDAIGQLQKLTDTTLLVVHRIFQTHASGATQTASTVHILSGGTIPYIRVRSGDVTNHVYADINCATMALAASGAAGTATLRSVLFERVGLTNKYTIKLAATYSAGITPLTVINLCQSVGVTTAYLGTQQYVYAGFGQHEAGRTEATPYISNLTTGSTSRQANLITAVLSNLNGGKNLAMIVNHRPYYAPSQTIKTANYQAGRIGSVLNDSHVMLVDAATAGISGVKKIAGANNASSATGATGAGFSTKWAFRVTENKIMLCVNGTLAPENSNTTTATNNSTLTLADTNSVFELIEIYRRNMPETELESKTT